MQNDLLLHFKIRAVIFNLIKKVLFWPSIFSRAHINATRCQRRPNFGLWWL